MEHSTLSTLGNLPVGCRFHPTDEELLLHYLKPKLIGDPIPSTCVVDLDIRNYHPRDLFLKSKGRNELYFFGRREYQNDGSTLRKRKIRDGGTWKSTGRPRPIALENDDNKIIGTKRSLVHKNPDGDAEFVTTEYDYTAQLDRPATGDYVIYKVSRKPHKKKAASKKPVKAEPLCRFPRPNKKARKERESSNCNAVSASASALGNNNLEDMIVNSAYGEGEQNNHLANMMTARSAYEKASVFKDQGRYKIASTSASNRGAGSRLMNPLISDQMTTVSTNKENGTPNKITEMSLYRTREPSCQRASGVENHNSEEVTALSSRNSDYGFMDKNPNYMTNNLFYDKTSLVTLDFDVQNPSEKLDISASDEGERSLLTVMSSDFDNQNRFQKTDISVSQDYQSLSMASNVGEIALQEIQSQHKKAKTPNLEDCYGSVKVASAGETTVKEVKGHHIRVDKFNLEEFLADLLTEDSATDVENSPRLAEITASLAYELKAPTHTHGNPSYRGFDASNCKKTDIPTIDDRYTNRVPWQLSV